MSDEAAKAWLSNHETPLPARDDDRHRVILMLQRGIASLAEIADLIVLDPGMHCLLMHQVNSQLQKSKRPSVDTVHTAVGLLGKPGITDMIQAQKTLAETCKQPSVLQSYQQIISKSHHALEQMTCFAHLQGIHSIDDMRAAMLLRSCAELSVCLFDAKRYQQYWQRVYQSKDRFADKTFDFNFTELGRQMAKKYAMPELLCESFANDNNISRKARLIQLAAEVSDQAELGWRHQGMLDAQKNCASFLDLDLQDAQQHIQSTSIQAARKSTIEGVFPAAAGLILLPDSAKPTRIVKPAAKPAPRAKTLDEKLKALVRLPNLNQTQVLGLLLKGLQQDLKFSRVALMLVSKDQKHIVARAGKGIPADAPFLKLSIDIAQSGLLKPLLEKPKALNVNPTSYIRYESMLPGKFRAACLCNSFVLMSIFIGNQPAGLVYADRTQATDDIDPAAYDAFKSSVMTTSKILTYLAKHKTQAMA